MHPKAEQVIEAVRYIQNHETGGRPELVALVAKINRYVQFNCFVVKLDMLPELAVLFDREYGGFNFVRLQDFDAVLMTVGPVFSIPELLEITTLERRWNSGEPPRVAAVYEKHGIDICHHAASLDLSLEDLEVFGSHFTVTEDTLDRLHKLPLKTPQIVSLLEDGIPVEKIISLTNELRRDGLRGLDNRVRAAALGHPKPLLGGVI
jgi:hypothetical protein